MLILVPDMDCMVSLVVVSHYGLRIGGGECDTLDFVNAKPQCLRFGALMIIGV